MIRAYLLYTGSDGDSHVKRGNIGNGALVKTDHALFKETEAHTSFEWHNAPIEQYVITLSGVLEFITKTGEGFTLYPGDVLLATDTTGSGHQWRLVNDEPWKRLYVVFQEGVDTHFVPDEA